jgi:N-acetylmuramoyl-L-alanine amidase
MRRRPARLLLWLAAALTWAACSGGGIASPPGSAGGVAATATATAEFATAPSTAASTTFPTPAPPAAPVPPATPSPGTRPADFDAPFVPANGRPRVVALDPGHGGDEVGAYGAGVAEKDVNLRIARRLRDLLEEDGVRVVLVRDCDCRATPPAGLEPPTSWNATRKDLQARIDIANRARADVYLSIHNNGNPDPSQSGTEVWWDGRRPFAAYNEALARLMLSSLVDHIRAAGYPTVNRGLQEDSNFRVFRGRSFPIFVLGPPRTGAATTRAAEMPAVLGETLFLSNPAEAPWLTHADIIEAIARGYQAALREYFAMIDSGVLAPPAGGFPPETPNYFDVQPPNPSNPGDSAPGSAPR